MTSSTSGALKELQELDGAIREAKAKVGEFETLLEEVGEPARALQSEVESTQSRLQEMRIDERRLELAVKEKTERVKKLEERLNTVRNVREETAVQTELEMIRRALEGEEQEAISLLDHIQRLEERLTEQEAELTVANAELEPRRAEFIEERSGSEAALQELEDKREKFVAGMEETELRVYESIRVGGRAVVVSDLTSDGACGHCFSLVPLQIQAEIRNGNEMIRCEACGVILTPSPDEALG